MKDLRALLLEDPLLTVAAAESLTCGHVQSLLGGISGASRFLLGGITTYTLEQKVEHLGVDRALAEPVNCVSAEVAGQMARGVCRLFSSSLGVATTGYAEPSQDWNVKEPYAWWAVACVPEKNGEVFVRCGRVDCPGAERVHVQELVARTVLSELSRYLREIRRP